ncbi:MAG: 3-oxoacyl-ACP reductase FabG [Firmicutes bacterium]|nr:3-oxoacyl-ACP reductase FabG [Bacillota bacterium]MCR4668935.1 3-oxoacyl-ACP reductase FabG [Clostridia bacterium]
MLLENKVCIVTGSSKGIGLAIAERFLKEGATVVVNSRSEERSVKTCEDLKAKGYDKVDYYTADISSKEADRKMIEYVVSKYGRLDVMVNNAGINKIAPSTELEEADYRRVLDTNLFGVFFCCQEAGKVMLEQKSGSIINISSVFGQETVGQRAAYTSSKAAVIGLTKVLGVEWASSGVRVNSVAPGYIATDMGIGDGAVGGYDDSMICRRTPLGRYGRVEEVASMVTYLASEEASFITGITYNVDGGWTAYGGW